MQSANPAKQKLIEIAKSARIDNGARKGTGATSESLFDNLQSMRNCGLEDISVEQCNDAHNGAQRYRVPGDETENDALISDLFGG